MILSYSGSALSTSTLLMPVINFIWRWYSSKHDRDGHLVLGSQISVDSRQVHSGLQLKLTCNEKLTAKLKLVHEQLSMHTSLMLLQNQFYAFSSFKFSK